MTRDPERIDEILDELEEYWKDNPDLRLGQIISNLSKERRGDSDPFYMEDGNVLRELKRKND